MKLKHIPKDMLMKISVRAGNWVTGHGGFSSYSSIAKNAIAEFLANQEGKTFYDYKEGTDNPSDRLEALEREDALKAKRMAVRLHDIVWSHVEDVGPEDGGVQKGSGRSGAVDIERWRKELEA